MCETRVDLRISICIEDISEMGERYEIIARVYRKEVSCG